MAKKLFGTDGVRGEANAGVMTVENALQIGRAVGILCKGRHERTRIIIGKDTRRSGYLFETAMVAGRKAKVTAMTTLFDSIKAKFVAASPTAHGSK